MLQNKEGFIHKGGIHRNMTDCSCPFNHENDVAAPIIINCFKDIPSIHVPKEYQAINNEPPLKVRAAGFLPGVLLFSDLSFEKFSPGFYFFPK